MVMNNIVMIDKGDDTLLTRATLGSGRVDLSDFSLSHTTFSPALKAALLARVTDQPGFVLHHYPYKETSLLIDVLCRDYGRITLVAKGAKRPHSALRSVLQTFQPLLLAWTGKTALRTLTAAQWVGGMPPLEKKRLLCAWYVNELVIKLIPHHESHPTFFDHYVSTLTHLAHTTSLSTVLRQFEVGLLKAMGVLGDLSCCVQSRQPVLLKTRYVVDPESGPIPATDENGLTVYGKTLLDIEAGDYSDIITQQQSKALMRTLLTYHLHGAPLYTKQILLELQTV